MDQNICAVCHQPILATYYFCPNCGAKIKEAPLSTTTQDQAKLYAFSIVLPWVAFLPIMRWKGIKYLRSADPKAKQIGIIACVLLTVSTLLMIYFTYVFTERLIQSQIDAINMDFGGL